MVYFEVLGQPFLVLDTLERTTDLLEKRSSNYSDRMRLPMLIELCVHLLHSTETNSLIHSLSTLEWAGTSTWRCYPITTGGGDIVVRSTNIFMEMLYRSTSPLNSESVVHFYSVCSIHQKIFCIISGSTSSSCNHLCLMIITSYPAPSLQRSCKSHMDTP